MDSKLLALPLKETLDTSIEKGVSVIIDETYHQSSSQFKTQLQPIDAMRVKIKSNVINHNSIIILKRYFNSISQLSDRFPQGIEFSWLNSFSDSSLTKVKSFRFEKIMILYQIAAMYSNLALTENELKTIGVYFQYSAGCLELIINDFESNGEIEGIDLTLNSIKSLYYLTLAQSQEIFWLKAKNDAIRDTVLIKLGKQVSIFYEKSFEFSKMSEKFNSNWCNYLQVKAIHFESATLFRYSQYLLSKGKFGDEISYLKQAESILNNQPTECSKDEILKDSKGLQVEIKKRLMVAERENDLIHLQEIPNFNDFKTIPHALLSNPVKPRELTEEYLADNKDLTMFDSLVPISVIEKCETFKIELNEYLNLDLIEPIKLIMADIDKFLNESQVETQLDSIIPQNIPESIVQYRDRIIEHGFVDKIINEMNKLNGLRVKCKNELEAILASIEKSDTPINEDDKNYNQLIKNFKIFQRYIIEGEKGDLTINKQIEDLKPFLDLFSSIESLNDFLPNPQIESLNSELINCVGKLKTILNEFNQLKEQCSNLNNSIDLKSKRLNIEMMNEIIKKFKATGDVVNKEILTIYINKFEDEVSRRNEIKSMESNIKLEFNSKFQRFLTLKSNVKVSIEREDSLNVLNSTFNGYFEILGNLKQGFEFYLNLQGRIKQEEVTLNNYINL